MDDAVTHNKQARKDRERKAFAQDIKARGGNPVTVSDIRQDASTRQRRGAAILSTLLH